MPNINVEISEGLMKAVRLAVAQSDFRQKDWVRRVLAEATNFEVGSPERWEPDEQSGVQGSGEKDHGKAGSDDTGGAANIRTTDEDTGEVYATRSTDRGKGLRSMWEKVRNKKGRGPRSERSRTVHGASSRTQSESGAVGGSTQEDSKGQTESERERRMKRWRS